MPFKSQALAAVALIASTTQAGAAMFLGSGATPYAGSEISRPSVNGRMVPTVVGPRFSRKILRSIVGLDAVLVMDDLAWLESPSKQGFHDEAVFIAPSIHRKNLDVAVLASRVAEGAEALRCGMLASLFVGPWPPELRRRSARTERSALTLDGFDGALMAGGETGCRRMPWHYETIAFNSGEYDA